MPYPTMIYKNFSGQNNTSSPDSLFPTELVTAQNVLFNNRGGYESAWGRVRHTTNALDANPVKKLISFDKNDGTTQKFYSSGTTIWRDNGDDTYTAIKNNLAGEITDYFTRAEDNKLYFHDGTNFYKTNGTTVESVTAFDGTYDLSAIKRCKYHEFDSTSFRHFWTGDSQDRSALYYSDDNDPSKTKAISKVYPTTNLGVATGIKFWDNNILVSYKKSWFRWYGGGINPVIDADWHKVKSSSGATSNKAIEPVRNALAYTSEDGVYLLQSIDVSAENNARKISKDIDTTYKTLIRKDQMTATFDGRFLVIGACNSGNYNNICLVADFDIIDEDGSPAWSIFTNCYVNDLLFIDGVIFFAHSNNGLVMKFDPTDYNNDGEALHMKAEHYLTLPDQNGVLNPFALHKIRSIILGGRAVATCVVTVTIEYQIKIFNVDMVESLIWGRNWGLSYGASDFVAKEGRVGKKARRVKVTIENNVLNEHFSLNAFGITYIPGITKGVKKGVITN